MSMLRTHAAPTTRGSTAPDGSRPPAHRRPAGGKLHADERNADVEVLRAVAILFTLFGHWIHSLLPALGPIGRILHQSTAFWTGVDLFFCISGFVIADSLLRQPPTSFTWASFRALVAPFWIRRAFRLLPSAWFWVIVWLLVAAFYNSRGYSGESLPATVRDAVFAMLNLANVHYIRCSPTDTCGNLGIFWSLSLEEQFYLVLPVLLFVVRSRTALIMLLGTLCVLQIAMPRPNGFLADGSPWWFVRTDAIILGVLIAFWRRSSSYASFEPRWLSSLGSRALFVGAGLAALAIAASPALGSDWGVGIAAIVSGVLIWAASYDRGYVMRDSRVRRLLVWIGARSYAMYLIHLLALNVSLETFARLVGKPLGQVSPAFGIGALVMAATLTVLAAELNFRYIESPLRRRGRQIAARVSAAGASRAGTTGAARETG
jgi:peptidoglycan/LPS O-acetylase OafA/YrhL